ncbi:MAG: DNA gyrase subunit A [Phycisphaerales bacterium]|nr:DNA gyrase subunit A [Phycisphaerales bacterium]
MPTFEPQNAASTTSELESKMVSGNASPGTPEELAGNPSAPASSGGNNGSGGDGGKGTDAAGGAGGGGGTHDLRIERELADSYLTYAMSTIMDRALPDVRDGLKPSQRRILVAMNDLRLYPGRKHLKCAKISGDTSGNYHPHGESVIYPTLVNMGQSWRMRTTLIDPQGNFGSINPDPPAAMRYTEARLTHAAVDMLADIDLKTVDMQPNYDDRLLEPTVLPGKFPNLLVNGGVGIAVGMATNIAPNNPIEVLDSIVRFIDNPDISLGELMTDLTDTEGRVVRRGIKGPDFPTGGTILGRRGIIDAYDTGRGKVTVRGRVTAEPLPGQKDRQQLVIDQVPFNVTLTNFIEKIEAAMEDDRIHDIADANNESSSKSPVRIVIDLKKGADPGVVEKQLYEYTPLQQSFTVQNIALVNRQPRTLSLREMIRYYVNHRVDVIRRRTAFLLNEARKRAHVLEGMIYAVCDIDEVIRIIRSSRTRQEAIERLMGRRFAIPEVHKYAPLLPARLLAYVRSFDDKGGVVLSRIQAETIGNMRLIQLVGLEVEKLTADYGALVSQIEEYERILATHRLVLDIIKADCDQMRARLLPTHGRRLTEIQEAADEDLDMGALIPVSQVAVTISRAGYAKRVPLDTYRQQGRGGKGVIGGRTKDEDFVEHLFVAGTHDDLLCFTDTGRVFKIKVYELPEMDRTAKGRPIVNLLEMKAGEQVKAFLTVKNFEEGSHFLTFATVRGIVKRTALKAYMNVNRGGLIAVDIREGDALLDVSLTTGNDDVLLATAQGSAIRFNETDAREMGRQAGGVKGMDLDDDDEIVGLVTVPMNTDAQDDTVTADPALCLLTITRNGYGKRTEIDEYRVQPEGGKARSQSRGGKGRVDIKTEGRNGPSVAAMGVMEGDGVMVITRQGQMVRIAAAEIRKVSRGSMGVRVVRLDEGDEVVAATRIVADGTGETGLPPPAAQTAEPA